MGTTVLMVTHNLALAAERADHLVVMNRGRIVESGPVGVVLPAPTDDYTKRLIAAAPSFSTEALVDRIVDEGVAAESGTPVDNVVDVVDLSKSFNIRLGLMGRGSRFKAVDDITFSIPRGKSVGIVGESGSGSPPPRRWC